MKDFANKHIVVTGVHDHLGARVFLDAQTRGADVYGIGTGPFADADLKGFDDAERERIANRYVSITPDHDFKFLETVAANVPESIDGLALCSELRGRDTKQGGILGVTNGEPNLLRYAMANYLAPTAIAETLSSRMAPGSSIAILGSNETDMTMGDDILFATSKAALIGLMSGLTTKLGPTVRVNMVLKGSVQNAVRSEKLAAHPEAMTLLEHWERRSPLGRSVLASEVSNAMLYLMSEGASGITGSTLRVDSGFHHQLWDPGWPGAEAYKKSI